MKPQPSNTSAGIAIGLLLFGCGTLLLNTLFGVWIAFSVTTTVALCLGLGAEVQHRRVEQRERELREWKRIVREEWGYRSD
ncbi:MAG: hypothetical protein WCD21_32710 [Streptomyces sp.]